MTEPMPIYHELDGDQLCGRLKDNHLGVVVASRVVEDITIDEGFFEAI